MEALKSIVRDTVTWYARGGVGANLRLFPVFDEEKQIYTVTAVNYPQYKQIAGVVVLARIVDDKVVIEYAGTDKPLVDALLKRGIPREQIILAYAGEPVPDPVSL
jgi:hypothetical protein